MNINLFIIGMIVLAIAGSAFGQQAPDKGPIGLEPLAGLRLADGGIAVTVMNKGYTTKDSFKVDVLSKDATGVPTVGIVRVNGDPGKMMPQPLEIVFPAKSFGLEKIGPFKIANPFYEKRF